MSADRAKMRLVYTHVGHRNIYYIVRYIILFSRTHVRNGESTSSARGQRSLPPAHVYYILRIAVVVVVVVVAFSFAFHFTCVFTFRSANMWNTRTRIVRVCVRARTKKIIRKTRRFLSLPATPIPARTLFAFVKKNVGKITKKQKYISSQHVRRRICMDDLPQQLSPLSDTLSSRMSGGGDGRGVCEPWPTFDDEAEDACDLDAREMNTVGNGGTSSGERKTTGTRSGRLSSIPSVFDHSLDPTCVWSWRRTRIAGEHDAISSIKQNRPKTEFDETSTCTHGPI